MLVPPPLFRMGQFWSHGDDFREMTEEWDRKSVQKSAHLDVVIRTVHLRVVFHIKAFIKAQGDEETFFQLNAV